MRQLRYPHPPDCTQLEGCGGAMRLVLLAITLAAFWMVNSGFFQPLLLAFGALSVGIGIYFAIAMRTADEEGYPVQTAIGAITYWPWLFWQIVLSSCRVAQIVIDPKLPISPTMTVVQSGQRTAAGQATYANSITLTPGTITAGVNGDDFTIHALERAGADDVETGAMNERVTEFEGRA
jgi:multicomponent Na+:H+ antiporter subunit E